MTAPRSEFQDLPRVLGSYPLAGDDGGASVAVGSAGGDGENGGEKLLVLVGGLHGNEPAGVLAIQKFFEELHKSDLRPRGRILGLCGNRRALFTGKRYLDVDLNRLWTEETVRFGAPPLDATAGVEQREQREMLDELETAFAERPSRSYLLDLHSTSAEGSPFVIMSDSLQNRPVATALGIPVVLGLEERVQGTLLSWFSEMGYSALCVEGGQNKEPSTVEHHLAIIWITLVAAGFLDEQDVSDLEARRQRLRGTAWGLPEYCEIRFRYKVPEGTKFEMIPGYTNFHLVSRGMHLADVSRPDTKDESGEEQVVKEVRCPHDGQLIMPRYQGQGNDGFFIGNEIPLWALRLSAAVRRLRLGPLLRALPGVSRDRSRARGLVIDKRIARWRTVEILHLFGYRRCAREGENLYFLRRPDRFS